MQFIIVKLILNIFSLHNSKNQSLRLVKLHTLPRKHVISNVPKIPGVVICEIHELFMVLHSELKHCNDSKIDFHHYIFLKF